MIKQKRLTTATRIKLYDWLEDQMRESFTTSYRSVADRATKELGFEISDVSIREWMQVKGVPLIESTKRASPRTQEAKDIAVLVMSVWRLHSRFEDQIEMHGDFKDLCKRLGIQ